MYTHSNKQDRNLFREEKWFEEEIPNRRRESTSGVSHPIVSELLADIIDYKQIGDLSDMLDYLIWLYKDTVHKTVRKIYSPGIYLDNHREDLVEVWYKWLGCLYRYHPNIFRILSQLGIVDTDLYFSPHAGHLCREENIHSSNIRKTIRTAEGAIKAIAYNLLRAHTSDVCVLNHLECELLKIQEKVQFCLEDTLDKFHRKCKKSFPVYSTNYIRELDYIKTKLVLHRRSF